MNSIDKEFKLSVSVANEILDRMGSLGLPPERGIEYVTVGFEEPLSILNEIYLKPIASGERGSAFKVIKGSFGSGKTHFLTCLRNLAWKSGFASVLTELSLTGCRFGRNEDVYKTIAEKVTAPPEDEFLFPEIVGIGPVIRNWAYSIDESEHADFLRRIKMARFENINFRHVFAAYCRALWEDNEDLADMCESWLCGSQVKNLKLGSLVIRECLNESSASSMIYSLVRALRMCGYPGIVLLFDEVDRAVAGGERERRSLADNMRQYTDRCSSQYPGMFWAFAVPPEFLTDVISKYPALQQRLNSPKPFSRACPQVPTIDASSSSLSESELLSAIGRKILEVAKTAWDWNYDESIQADNLSRLVDAYLNESFDAGQRRNFVRRWIAVLNTQHFEGEGCAEIDSVSIFEDDRSYDEEFEDF